MAPKSEPGGAIDSAETRSRFKYCAGRKIDAQLDMQFQPSLPKGKDIAREGDEG